MGSFPLLAGRSFWGQGALATEARRVRAAVHGDRAAFDELVAAYDPELRRYVGKRIIAGSVDDVLQDVWLGAWASLPNFDHRSRFKTWLYGICLYKIRDHYRASKRSIHEVALEDDLVIPQGIGIDAATIAALPGMLADLTENQREVLELYYYSQLTLPEISTALNRNLNTVKYQFYRAHSQLADMFQEDL